jgi:hypothetical protein
MRIRHRLATTLSAGLLTGAALILTPATAGAATTDTTPTNFGQHVRTCAQEMGFSGDHNPGMHHGAAGWDGTPCA